MSNLGWYQKITTAAKRVGGPKNLILLIGVGGYGILRLGEAGTKKFVRAIIQYKENKKFSSKLYVVLAEGESNEGLLFKIGDTFRVLEADGDAILIEKIGEKSNPYFVDKELLLTISDYAPQEK